MKKIILFVYLAALTSFFFVPSVQSKNFDSLNLSGKILKNGRVIFQKHQLTQPKQKIILGLESDRIQIKILDKPNKIYSSGQVNVDLSGLGIQNYNKTSLRSFGIHGVDYTDQNLNGNVATFVANNIIDEGIWTVEIIFPKDIIKPSLYQKILYWSANGSLVWLLTSFFLFIIAVSIILFLLWKRRLLEKNLLTKEITNAPPTDLPSFALAILEEKQASYRALATGILYLAARGFLAIAKDPNGYKIAKRKEPGGLSGIDQDIYDLLIGNWFAKSIQEIEIEQSRSIFNQAVGSIHQKIYQILIERKLFVQDPWLSTHLTKIIGIGATLFSMIGFIMSLIILPYPPFASFVWIALIVVSLIIIKIAPKIPLRSIKGVQERQSWQPFKNYLTDRSPISLLDIPMDMYLHFAIALQCEIPWITRYTSGQHIIPEWYIGQAQTIADVAVDIVGFVNQISSILIDYIPPEEK